MHGSPLRMVSSSGHIRLAASTPPMPCASAAKPLALARAPAVSPCGHFNRFGSQQQFRWASAVAPTAERAALAKLQSAAPARKLCCAPCDRSHRSLEGRVCPMLQQQPDHRRMAARCRCVEGGPCGLRRPAACHGRAVNVGLKVRSGMPRTNGCAWNGNAAAALRTLGQVAETIPSPWHPLRRRVQGACGPLRHGQLLLLDAAGVLQPANSSKAVRVQHPARRLQ